MRRVSARRVTRIDPLAEPEEKLPTPLTDRHADGMSTPSTRPVDRPREARTDRPRGRGERAPVWRGVAAVHARVLAAWPVDA